MKINIDRLNFDDWSDTTKDIRKRQLKTLNLIMGNSSEIFDTELYENYEISIKRIDLFFKNPSLYIKTSKNGNLEIETKLSYMSCLLKVLREVVEKFPSETYVKYQNYYSNLELEKKTILMTRKSELNGDKFLETQKFINELFIVNNERYRLKEFLNINYILTLIRMIDINKNDYGILRLSDLIHITLRPLLKDRFSYIDLSTGEVSILGQYTKNRKGRKFYFPMEFIEYIKHISNIDDRKFLLVKKDGTKYNDTSTLSTMLKKELNMSYLEIRHQYVTYLHLHSDLEHAKNGAQNMGHSLSMAISTYNDLSIDEED
jgi:hypothetical protein